MNALEAALNRFNQAKAQAKEITPSVTPSYGATPPDMTISLVLPTPAPTEAQLGLVFDYVLRQTKVLRDWAFKRECAYWLHYRWPEPLSAYQAALDAACWQQQKEPSQTLERLEGFEEAARTFPPFL